MFAWENGAILRLMRHAGAGGRLEWEKKSLEAARSCGVRVPDVMGMVTVMERPGMVMERIQGVDMLTELGRRPWKVWSSGRILGAVHAGLAGARAPAALPPLRDSIMARIAFSSRVPPDIASAVAPVLNRLPNGDSLCHGDYHPANVIVSPDGPVIIDWTNARRGDPDGDLARSLVILRFGTVPPGTALFLRVATRFARSLLISAYIRSYRRERPVDTGRLHDWVFVRAAERLIEDVEGERDVILKFLRGRSPPAS